MCCGEQGVCRQKNAGMIWNLRFFGSVSEQMGCESRYLSASRDISDAIAISHVAVSAFQAGETVRKLGQL